MRNPLLSISLLIVLFISVCSDSFADLKVSEAKVRLLPPMVPNTSAYFSITNTGEKDRVLVAATSEIAKTIELHAHIMKDGMMSMQQQEKVVIPAGQTVEFKPGGLHLMIFGLIKPLRVDQKVDLNLITEDGETIAISGTVVQPGKEKSKHHHH